MLNPEPYSDQSPANTGSKWGYGAALAVIVAIAVIIAAMSHEANKRSYQTAGTNTPSVGRGTAGMATPAPAAPATPTAPAAAAR
jgi:hypothetical protein